MSENKFMSKNHSLITFFAPKPPEITKAIYLMGSKSAFNNGHAAVLLIDKAGNGYFYSTIFSIEKTPKVLWGESAAFNLYKKVLNPTEVQEYFKTGKIPGTEDNLVQLYYLSNYDKYIIIPITSKVQGESIYKRAEQIHKNPKDFKFNLFAHNCNHITQDILEAGNVNFMPSKADSEELKKQFSLVTQNLKERKIFSAIYWSIVTYHKNYEVGNIPNGAFERGVEWAKKNNFEYGTIEPKVENKIPSINERSRVEINLTPKNSTKNLCMQM